MVKGFHCCWDVPDGVSSGAPLLTQLLLALLPRDFLVFACIFFLFSIDSVDVAQSTAANFIENQLEKEWCMPTGDQ